MVLPSIQKELHIMSLALSRKPDEMLVVFTPSGEQLEIRVGEYDRRQIQLHLSAPNDYKI